MSNDNPTSQPDADSLVEINKTLANLNKTISMMSRRLLDLEQAQITGGSSDDWQVFEPATLPSPLTLFDEVKTIARFGLDQIRDRVTTTLKFRIKNLIRTSIGLEPIENMEVGGIQSWTPSKEEFTSDDSQEWKVPPQAFTNCWYVPGIR